MEDEVVPVNLVARPDRARVPRVEIVFEDLLTGPCSHVPALQGPGGLVRWLRKLEKLKSAAVPTV